MKKNIPILIPHSIYYKLFGILSFLITIGLFYEFYDTLSGIITEIIGIVLTLYIVERTLKNYEKEKRKNLDIHIKKEILNTLRLIYNYLFIHSKQMQEFLIINNKDLDLSEKVKYFADALLALSADEKYLEHILQDNHLYEFYTKAYDGFSKKLDDIFQSYNYYLDPDLITSILNLKASLLKLNSTQERYLPFYLFEELKNTNMNIAKEIKIELSEVITLANQLAREVIK